jgi:uncharacterized membrane protein YozB (DUF420 family)
MLKNKAMFALGTLANIFAILILVFNWMPGLPSLSKVTTDSFFVPAICLVLIFAIFSFASGVYLILNNNEKQTKKFAIINTTVTMVFILFIYQLCLINGESMFGDTPPWKLSSDGMVLGYLSWFLLIIATVVEILLTVNLIKKRKSLFDF